ncbi:RDD family protein [Scleromatobacter humisilvae]|uniref:RDD family protein n=1 Tax=Scleromatobacter humisilvae TaxID=2897159 RepID=A0A9X1YL17_9BURK|nr:RDD family protein [Scleromatobacter humisilvae]MCK9688274.1 RDD family protein [Scleromatobacter humisilvae]
MSAIAAQNRFAPPRADVELQADVEAGLVEAGRGARLLAVLIDSVPTIILTLGIVAAVAIPAYERYKQEHTPGIDPPALGSGHHMTGTWALLAGIALLAYAIYSIVLVYRYGQTFGKRMMNIRVVRVDGGRVTFGRFVFLRWLPLAVVGMIPFIGGIVALVDPLLIFRESSRCLHDDIADTRVVTAASSVDATLNGDAKYASATLRTIDF